MPLNRLRSLLRLTALVAVVAARPLAGALPRPADPSGRFGFKGYATDQGLKNQAIWALLQDQQRFLWVGTEDGLYRYDGSQFEAFGTREGVPSNYIECLLQQPNGAFWAGTYKGLARWDHGHFIAMHQGLPEGEVTALATASDNELWVGTGQGPYHLVAPDRFQQAPDWPGAGVTALWGHPGTDELWAASWSGVEARVYHRQQGKWQLWSGGPGFNRTRLDALVVDGQGRVWARSLRALWCLAPGASSFQAYRPGVPDTQEKGCLYLDAEDRLWIPTDRGLYRLEQGRMVTLGTRQGLPKAWSSALLEDREGSLWIGGDALSRLLAGGVLQAFGLPEGLPNETVWCVFRDRKGRLYAGTDSGVGQARGNGWRLLPGTGGFQVRTMVEGPDGALYLAGGPEVLRVDPDSGAITRFGVTAGVLANGRIFRLLFDREGVLWAATDGGGLLRGSCHGKAWTFCRQPLPGTHAGERIADLYLDSAGRLWGAGEKGLFLHDQGGWRRFTTREGLEKDHVSYVTGTRSGDLIVVYFESAGMSRLRYDGKTLKVLSRLDAGTGLASDKVYLAGEDCRGNFWIGTGMGLDLITPQGAIQHFGHSEGLAGDDTDAMAFLAEPGGEVWFGTSSGLARFDPRAYRGIPEPPASEIYAYKQGNGAFEPLGAGALKVPSRGGALEIRFAGVSFILENQVQIQTRLVGLEPEWRNAEGRSQRFPGLAPGPYTFEVRTRIGQGAWGPATRLEFEVTPAWWQALWFKGLLGLTGAALLALAANWRLGALRRRNRVLQEMVAARTRDLEKANEALRDQSLTDPLTGLRNRRYLNACMPEDVAQVDRVHRTTAMGREDRLLLNVDLVFIMLDIDHFKRVNDQHGHGAGDLVIQQIGAIIQHATRDSDTAVRWGGEEFLVVARNVNRREGTILVERIRAQVAAHAFAIGDGVSLHCTCSLGFAFYPFATEAPGTLTWEQVVKLADTCLYVAKRGGRNAWVGIFPAADRACLPRPGGGPMPIGAWLAEGSLEVATSIEDSSLLHWEA